MGKIKDYLRLSTTNATEKKYFEEFLKDIFVHTLKWEGVPDPSKGGNLHNVSGDTGGPTIWGIAYNKNKDLFTDLQEFKKLTYEEAGAIAYIRYYKSTQAYIVPKEVRLMYFDIAYNMGNLQAIKLLQRCCGVTADGVIGPMTKEKMKFVTEECLAKSREEFYRSLAKNKPSLVKFLKGWLNRIVGIKNAN